MARKVKIPNHVQKRLARDEHKRKRNTKDKRKYFLIVCEGEKTEPNYPVSKSYTFFSEFSPKCLI